MAAPFPLGPFECPHCGVQVTGQPTDVFIKQENKQGTTYEQIPSWAAVRCKNCGGRILVINGQPEWPETRAGPSPSPMMHQSVLAQYLEADRLLRRSPRDSVAVLRLALRTLCDVHGASTGSVVQDIEALLQARGQFLKAVLKELEGLLPTSGKDADLGTLEPVTPDKDPRGMAMGLFQLLNKLSNLL